MQRSGLRAPEAGSPIPPVFATTQTTPCGVSILRLGRQNSVPGTVSQLTRQEISMNKDQVKGRIKEAGGKIKETTGKAVGNPTLEQRGKVQKVVGKVQAAYGDIKADAKSNTSKPV